MLLLVNFFWGMSFPLIKGVVLAHEQVLPASDGWFLTAYALAPRFLISSLVLAILLGRRLRTLRVGEFAQGLKLGLAASVGMLLQNDGLRFTAASTSAFLTQLTVLIIPLITAVRVRRWPPLLVWVACGLVLTGVGVLARFDFTTMRLGRGELETLLSSGFFTMMIFVLDDRAHVGNRALFVSLMMFATEAVIFTAPAGFAAPHAADLLVPWTSGPWVACTLALTVFCTLGAFTLMNKWQPYITATEAGLLYCLEPVFAALMALFLPGLLSTWAGFDYANERLTTHLLVGGGLITLANILLQFRPPARAD